MNRCFIDTILPAGREIELAPKESHHLLAVLRGKPGETVEVFDGRGRVAGAKLISGRANIARLAILPDSIRMIAPDPVSITLIQAVPKHAGMEEIIQKAVELGVQKIIPVITERVVVKFKSVGRGVPALTCGECTERTCGEHSRTSRSEYNRTSKVEGPSRLKNGCLGEASLPSNLHLVRWRKIALAAAKQCHTAWLTEISPIVPLVDAVKVVQSDLRLFGSLAPQTPSLQDVLGSINHPTVKSIALAIGPEGDFTEAESELLLAAGFKPAGFGNRVLRVETAAVFGLSALNYEFRETKAEGT